MLFARFAGMGGDALVRFIGENHYVTAGGNLDLVFASGAQVGDLAIIIGVDDGSITGLSGWSHATPQTWAGGNRNDVWWKPLTQADITAGKVTVGNTPSGGVICVVIYRGPTSLAVVSSASNTASTLTIPGYTRSSLAKAVLSYVGSDNGTSASAAGANVRVAPFNSSVLGLAVSDILPASLYVDGSAVAWTGLPASNVAGQILELT